MLYCLFNYSLRARFKAGYLNTLKQRTIYFFSALFVSLQSGKEIYLQKYKEKQKEGDRQASFASAYTAWAKTFFNDIKAILSLATDKTNE